MHGKLTKNCAFPTGAPEKCLKTAFEIKKSAAALFLKIEAEDENPQATLTGYNQALYNEEVLEFFLSPNGGADKYFEFEINYLGAVFAAWINHKNNNEILFCEENPAKTRVTKTENGWTAEVELPLSMFNLESPTFNAGHNGGSPTFNVYRIKRTETGAMMLYAYSPTGKENFHMPECFAKLDLEGSN